MTDTIGFIGLGVLGSAMAGNLVKSGFPVIGCDIDPEKMTALEDDGGQSATSPKDVAERADVVVLCLPTAAVLHDVVGGKDGVKNGGKEGQIVLEVSTFAIADKEQARDTLAAAGKILLDCPVSGNRILALKKQLTAFGSGDEAAYKAVEHIIDGFAHRKFYVGEFGCGMKMKFCGNILNLVHNSAAAEVKEAELYTIKTALKLGVHPRVELGSPEDALPYLELGVKHFNLGSELSILRNFWAIGGKELRDIVAKG